MFFFKHVDDWHDYIRLADLVLAFTNLYLLGIGYRKMGRYYNTKTRDLWFAVVLWCITSVALATEGLYEDRPVEPRLICYSLATLLTFKVLLNRNSWVVAPTDVSSKRD